jgi:nucleotide-binding universal stress UspA family protein
LSTKAERRSANASGCSQCGKWPACGFEVIVTDLENRLAALIRRVNASDLDRSIFLAHGASIYAESLGFAEKAGADLIVVGSHRPAMEDYLLGTNASRVVRHARCSVLVAGE